jgi:SAM-dependent methyltransferase
VTTQDLPDPVLSGQQQHWEKMYVENDSMFGTEPSYAARKAAEYFKNTGARRILELGSGQGRDTLFFAEQGFHVYGLDYSYEGLDSLREEVQDLGFTESVTTVYHDVRERLPFDDHFFDACYSHMLYCMALTTPELESLSSEIHRVLRPGGLNVYTARTTSDPHYRTGIDRGDDMWEIAGGFIVHFFSQEKVVDLSKGYEIVSVEEFEETELPKRLFLVTLKRGSH